MIPARDLDEFHMLPQSDRDFISGWFNWTDANLAYLRAQKENAVLFFAKLLSFLDETRSLDLSRQAWDGFTAFFLSRRQHHPDCDAARTGSRACRRHGSDVRGGRLHLSIQPVSAHPQRQPRGRRVAGCGRKPPVCAIFTGIYKTDHFAQAGSAQTRETVEKKGGRFLQV